MKPQNAKERTRAILQFAGLFVLATLLAGSTVYLPGNVTRKSYEQLEQELSRYKAQAAAQEQFATRFARQDEAIRRALAATDSLVRELEKLPPGTRTANVELHEAIAQQLEKANLAAAAAEKMTTASRDASRASLLAAYREAVVDKKKLVEYIETVQETPAPAPGNELMAMDKIERQQAQIEKLQEEKLALKQKYEQCVSSMSNDCRILNNKISQYEDHFKKISTFAATIQDAAHKVEQNRKEMVIGKDYKIVDIESYTKGLNQIGHSTQNIIDLALPKR